ncbi:MAG: hypothetical protein O4965_08220, partial [Trichodesmium sp. St19_bin1]|nr:hypothetical protein [Trichodesmium sp. St19_bin1]
NLLTQNSNDNSCIFLYYMREVPNVGLNLSYQKAHRDYANASQEQQKIFILTGLTQDHYI